MTRKERIIRMLNLEKVDRIPLLGGFLVSGKHYQRITNISEDLFFEEPDKYAIGECGIVQNEKL
ncbi:hypothetical protein H8E77_21495 [bacterium]|nr:hypothetical protein [bacterium]